MQRPLGASRRLKPSPSPLQLLSRSPHQSPLLNQKSSWRLRDVVSQPPSGVCCGVSRSVGTDLSLHVLAATKLVGLLAIIERMFGSPVHDYWEPPVTAESGALFERLAAGVASGESGGGGAVAGDL